MNRGITWSLAALSLFIARIVQAQSEMPGMTTQGGDGVAPCSMMSMGSGWMMAGMALTGILAIVGLGAIVVWTTSRGRRDRTIVTGAE